MFKVSWGKFFFELIKIIIIVIPVSKGVLYVESTPVRNLVTKKTRFC